MKINYISHGFIDVNKWDTCIDKAVDGVVFAYSWYLNTVCNEWDALIDENYDFVMPLPIVSRLRGKNAVMPEFIGCLGIFSKFPLTSEITEQFLKAIPQEFRYIHILLHKYLNSTLLNFGLKENYKKAFELDLIRNYSHISNHYSNFLKEILNSYERKQYNLVAGIQLMDLLQLHNDNASFSSTKLSNDQLKVIRKLGLLCLRLNSGDIIGAYNNQNLLCAAALFISSHNKAYILFSAQTRLASKENVWLYILDYFIKKHSEKNLTLCIFEKVETKSVLRLFGAISTKYPVLQINKKPWYLKGTN